MKVFVKLFRDVEYNWYNSYFTLVRFKSQKYNLKKNKRPKTIIICTAFGVCPIRWVCFLYFSCFYWEIISCLSSSIILVNKDIENIHNFVWTTRKYTTCTLYFCFHISSHTLISWHMLQPTEFFLPHIGSLCFTSEKFKLRKIQAVVDY